MPSEKLIADQLFTHKDRQKVLLDWRNYLFTPQLAFVLDESRQQTAVCTRRAGKTYGCAAKLLRTALKKPGSVALYLTLSRKNSKFIVWEPLKDLIRRIGILDTVKINESDLTVTLENGARIQISGVNDATKVDDFRGFPYSLAIIDEAQSFPLYLQKLIDDAVAPGLMDYRGTLALIGTPGPVPVGYFWDAVGGKAAAKWSHHYWTAFDNPWIREKSGGYSAEQLLQEELDRRGVTQDDPSIQREWFGKWVYDANSMVFKWDSRKNGILTLPDDLTDYVIGVDIGFDDADAIAVLGWNEHSPNLYLVDELVVNHQGITELADQITARMEKYKPLSVVMDTGGLGKKIAAEIIKRHSVPVIAAEKVRKHEHIELLNDAMRTRKFFANPNSRFVHDCMKVEWDRTDPTNPKVNDAKFHSDMCDCVLYAYRAAQHFTYRAPHKPLPVPYSQAWHEMRLNEQKAQQKQIEERALNRLAKIREEREYWQDQFDPSDFSIDQDT